MLSVVVFNVGLHNIMTHVKYGGVLFCVGLYNVLT